MASGIYSMNFAAKMIASSFTWMSKEEADRIVHAYVWSVHAEHEQMVSQWDVERIKAMAFLWLAQTDLDVSTAIDNELNEIFS